METRPVLAAAVVALREWLGRPVAAVSLAALANLDKTQAWLQDRMLAERRLLVSEQMEQRGKAAPPTVPVAQRVAATV